MAFPPYGRIEGRFIPSSAKGWRIRMSNFQKILDEMLVVAVNSSGIKVKHGGGWIRDKWKIKRRNGSDVYR